MFALLRTVIPPTVIEPPFVIPEVVTPIAAGSFSFPPNSPNTNPNNEASALTLNKRWIASRAKSFHKLDQMDRSVLP